MSCSRKAKANLKALNSSATDETITDVIGALKSMDIDTKLAAAKIVGLIKMEDPDVRAQILKASTIEDIQNIQDGQEAAKLTGNISFDFNDQARLADLLSGKETLATTQLGEVEVGKIGKGIAVTDKRMLKVERAKGKRLSIAEEDVTILDRRTHRESLLEGLKVDTANGWEAFLTAYFEGRTSMGMRFKEMVDDIIADSTVNYANGIGFTTDINASITGAKDLSDAKLLMHTAKVATMESAEERYFAEILAADFDFAMSIVGGMIQVDEDGDPDKVVTLFGLTDPDTLDDVNISVDLSQIPSAVLAEMGEYDMAQDANGDSIVGEREFIIYDLEDAPIESMIMPHSEGKKSFSRVAGQVFYTTEEGVKIEVTPKPFYSLNTKSDVNKDSLDPVVDSFSQDTEFMANFFTTMRLIDNDGKPGRRMSKADYMRIAPLLVGEVQNLEQRLEEIGNTTTPVAAIARALHASIFSMVPVHGLISLAQIGGNSNMNIVAGMAANLTSKDQMRYVFLNNGKIKMTRKATDAGFEFMVDDALSYALLDGRHTKASIAHMFGVTKSSTEDDVLTVQLPSSHAKPLSKLRSVADINELAETLGLSELRGRLEDHLLSVHSDIDVVNEKVRNIFKAIAEIAAANAAGKSNVTYNPTRKTDQTSASFAKYPPAALLTDFTKDIESVLGADVGKGETIAGVKMPSSSPTDRNASLPKQISKANEFNKGYNKIKTGFNAFVVEGLDPDIPKASYNGNLIKSPMKANGETIGLSDWTLKVRTEFSVIQGMFSMPGTTGVGRKMFLQPVAYSDKSMIPMHEIELDFNAFAPGSKKKLEKAWRAYNVNKNVDLQRISINKVGEFVGANFSKIAAEVQKNDPDGARMAALKQLMLDIDAIVAKPAPRLSHMDEEYLGEIPTARDFDLTRSLNMQLDILKLPADIIAYSDSELDADVDLVEIGGTLVFKPHLGVRAAQIAGSEAGLDTDAIYAELEKMGFDFPAMTTAARDVGIKLNQKELLSRVAMLNGIYGHSLKVLTMGDESYFDTYYPDSSIDAYYKDTDTNPERALADTADMMVKQSKRAQSNLTRGIVYKGARTVTGMVKESAKNNIVNHIQIRNIHTPQPTYDLSALEGKDLQELKSMGVINHLPTSANGMAILSKNNVVMVNFEGNAEAMPLTGNIENNALSKKMGVSLYRDIKALLNLASAASLSLNNKRFSILLHRGNKDLLDMSSHPLSNDITSYLTIANISDGLRAARQSKEVLVADHTPMLLLDDPVSNVDLLNSMGVNQENSDAVMFMHPLYELLFKSSRGGNTSGFNSDQSNALKTLTTSMEYGSFRQQLQKKSVQNAFSMEQLTKLGGPEVFAMLKKMNTAIKFPSPLMTVPQVDARGRILEDASGNPIMMEGNFDNLQQLFDYFKGNARTDNSGWTDVLDVLKNHGENMHSFIGVISLPSGQKTGRRKLNKWDDVFSNNTAPLNIDHMAQEYNMEVLTKQHEYDTSSNAKHRAKIALLSQLVNAIGFGGLTNVETQNLQNALEGASDVNSIFLGDTVLTAAIEAGEINIDELATNHPALLKSLKEGTFAKALLPESSHDMFDKIFKVGLTDMVVAAFDQDADSELIKTILEQSGAALDTPAVRAKIIGDIRSGFYKSVIQSKMAGFIGTVSTIHNVINVHDFGNGRRGGRQAYIQYKFSKGEQELVTPENSARLMAAATPVDTVMYNGEVMPLAAVEDTTAGELWMAPPAARSSELDLTAFEDMPDRKKVSIKLKGKNHVVPKWRAIEMIKEAHESVETMIIEKNMTRYSQDDNNLKWYRFRSRDGRNIEETDQYKAAYRHQQSRKRSYETAEGYDEFAKKAERLSADLILELQSLDSNGKKVWDVTLPEVVTPTFNMSAFGIKAGVSLHLIIGTDGAELANATAYFEAQTDKRFKLDERETANTEGYLTRFLKKKASRIAQASPVELDMYNDIIEYLTTAIEQGNLEIATSGINNIITEAKKKAAFNKAEAFLKSLDVTMTRIPGQTKQSGFGGRVIEFLDAQGNATFAPTEHLVQTGGDFDIDTLSVLTKLVGVDGVFESYTKFLNDDGILDNAQLKSYFVGKLTDIAVDVQATADAYNARLTRRLSEKRDELKDVHADTSKTARAIKRSSISLEKEIALLEKNTITPEDVYKTIQKAKKIEYQKMRDLVDNAVEEGVHVGVTKVDTAVETQTPVSFSLFGGIVANLESYEEMKNDPMTKYKHSEYKVNGESFISHFIIEDLAAQGKEAIGIFATVLKMNSAVQGARYSFNSSKAIKHIDPFVWHHSIKYEDPNALGTHKNISRTTFADIDSYNMTVEIANNAKLQHVLKELAKTGELSGDLDASINMLTDMLLNEITNTMSALEEKGYKFSKFEMNTILHDKVKSLFGIDIKKELKLADMHAISGTSLAEELC